METWQTIQEAVRHEFLPRVEENVRAMLARKLAELLADGKTYGVKIQVERQFGVRPDEFGMMMPYHQVRGWIEIQQVRTIDLHVHEPRNYAKLPLGRVSVSALQEIRYRIKRAFNMRREWPAV